jgi:3-dehydroquinate dehydratase II
MVKILLLQGANLTFLGRREPEIYGSTTPPELDAMLRRHAHDHAYQLDIFYTNIEGEAINRIYQAADEGFDGLVMNPAGFTYAGFALKDCIKGAGLPYVEVHISNIAKRNIHCVWDADMLVPPAQSDRHLIRVHGSPSRSRVTACSLVQFFQRQSTDLPLRCPQSQFLSGSRVSPSQVRHRMCERPRQ